MVVLIVIVCLLCHIALASGTRYLVEIVCEPDNYDAGIVTAACTFVWPLVLIYVPVAWARDLGKNRDHRDMLKAHRTQILALQVEISTLKAQLHEALKKPLSQGAFR